MVRRACSEGGEGTNVEDMVVYLWQRLVSIRECRYRIDYTWKLD